MGKLRRNFGKRIRQIRKAKGITQEKLAEKANLEPAYLGAVERGERNLTIDNIEKIARGFRLQPYQLFMFQFKSVVDDHTITQEKILDIIQNIPKKKKKQILLIVRACTQLGS